MPAGAGGAGLDTTPVNQFIYGPTAQYGGGGPRGLDYMSLGRDLSGGSPLTNLSFRIPNLEGYLSGIKPTQALVPPEITREYEKWSKYGSGEPPWQTLANAARIGSYLNQNPQVNAFLTQYALQDKGVNQWLRQNYGQDGRGMPWDAWAKTHGVRRAVRRAAYGQDPQMGHLPNIGSGPEFNALAGHIASIMGEYKDVPRQKFTPPGGALGHPCTRP